MRMKKFTLLTLALFVMSVVAFAQKTALPQLLQKGPANLPTASQRTDVKTLKRTDINRSVQRAPIASAARAASDPTMATITLTAGDIWGDGTGYQMLLDADATAYGTVIPETGALNTSGDVSDDIYDEFEYKIPTNADGVLTTTNKVLNNSITIEIPGGTYDWCITNPTPGDRMWIASNYGSIPGRYDDYVFEAGHSYEFVVTTDGSNDGIELFIDGGPSLVELPEGLEPLSFAGIDGGLYLYSSYYGWQIATMPNINVAIDGTDIYIQGLAYNCPEAWIKGTLSDGFATFESGQFAGLSGYGSSSYIVGSPDGETFVPIVFAWDEEAGTLTCQINYILETRGATSTSCYSYWNKPTFAIIPDVAAIPAQSEILETQLFASNPYILYDVPTLDVNGNPVLTSKLSYQIWYEEDHVAKTLTLTPEFYPALKEEITEIPYGFSDGTDIYTNGIYLNMDFSKWKKVGIQSIYRGGDEINKSEIFWYSLIGITFASSNGNTFESITVDDIDMTDEISANRLIIEEDGAVITLHAGKQNKFTSVTVTKQEMGKIAANEIRYELNDSYGDGWTGNSIQIVNTNTEDLVGTLTLTSGSSYSGTATLTPGETYNFIWHTGSYSDECSFIISDPDGNIIASVSAGSSLSNNEVIATYTVPADAGEAQKPETFDVIISEGGATATFEMPYDNVIVSYVLESRETIELTLPAGQYSTYYSDKALTCDNSNVIIYTIVSVTGTNVVLSDPIDVAPAETPLLIYNSGKKKAINLIITDIPADEVEPADEFKGTLVEQEMDGSSENTDFFVCDGTAFVWVKDAGTIGANKCWLEVSKGMPLSARLNIVANGSETTGITNVNLNVNNNNVYDLQGRRIAQPTKGIYIMNGKKVFVK